MAPQDSGPADPFSSPGEYVKIPRLSSLTLSPDGDRLVAAIASLDDDGAKFVSSLYELDPAGSRPARQLTRSSEGESAASFLPDGSLLFVSRRARLEGGDQKDEGAALFLLPAESGDAFVVASRPGGIEGVVTARESRRVVVVARSAPGGPDDEADKAWWEARRKQKVSASLYESLPVRHWDSYLGPDEPHLYAATLEPGVSAAVSLSDLTPDAGQALVETHPTLSPDGATLFVEWRVPIGRGRSRTDIVEIDTGSGARRTLLSSEEAAYDFDQPAVSPDGRQLVAVRTSRATLSEPSEVDLCLLDLASGESRVLGVGDEPYVHSAVFSADGGALYVVTDQRGHGPLYRLELSSGAATRLTADGAFSFPQATPDGEALFAVADMPDRPPRAVRLTLSGEGGPEVLDAPGAIDRLPGRLEEVSSEVADGSTVRGWLVLPEGASAESPAPLALFVHGGPVASWKGWHWRWNPWLLAARGWAVLMPDPALSTGYGQQMVRRGWGQWGGAPFDDLMAITDAALQRPDLDSSRTAALGGSYGGYMANWIAGHTDRFSAIVSHASLWSLEQFQATTDWPAFWAEEWGYPDTNPDLYAKWSPDRAADAITTPLLLIHGERDYRCPVGESLRLWSDLTRRGVEARFLWFSEEGHWIMKPGDVVVWYETVLAFLEEKVLGRPFERPRML